MSGFQRRETRIFLETIAFGAGIDSRVVRVNAGLAADSFWGAIGIRIFPVSLGLSTGLNAGVKQDGAAVPAVAPFAAGMATAVGWSPFSSFGAPPFAAPAAGLIIGPANMQFIPLRPSLVPADLGAFWMVLQRNQSVDAETWDFTVALERLR